MKSVRFRFAGLIAGFAALSFLAVAAGAAPAKNSAPAPAPANANKPAQPSETKEFGDWSVRCYPATSATPCEMIELLVNKKSGRRVLGVLLVYNQARNQNLLQIAVPLGVMLQNGAVLGSDTYTSGVMHFRLCDMQGCYVVAPLDNDAVKAIGQATKAEVRIVSTEGKNFNITFSLNGFTAAYNALLDLTRQKSPAAPSTEQSH
ncbi:MAG: invasion associated locus B family protein [Rhizomicrobium sp.]